MAVHRDKGAVGRGAWQPMGTGTEAAAVEVKGVDRDRATVPQPPSALSSRRRPVSGVPQRSLIDGSGLRPGRRGD